MTVASVDGHPEVTLALAVIVLDVMDALNISSGAQKAKTDLVQTLPSADLDDFCAAI